MRHVPVSAIVPTYNRGTFLRQALASILSGTVVPADIIVVDDGSLDDTAQVAAEFAPLVRYAHQSNAGKSVALNLGLSLVRQPLVWIMDDDDLVRPDGLDKLLAALSSDPSAGFACGRYETFSEGKTSEHRPPLIPHPDAESFHLGQLLGCSVLQPAMLVRKSCYDAVGPFDTNLLRSQDYDMLLRLARRFSAVEIAEPVFDQRQHDAVRGPAALQQQPTSSVSLWRRYDEFIFRRIHAQYDLAEYLPPTARSDAAARHKALVRRAAIMGRRGLWDLALPDLEQAKACSPRALTEVDAAIFRSALPPFSPSPVAVPLRRLERIVRSFDPAGRALLLAIVRASRRVIRRNRTRRLLRLMKHPSHLTRKIVAHLWLGG